MDQSEIKEVLLDEFDMQIAHVDKAVERIHKFDGMLAEAFVAYVKDKKIPELSEGKYAFEILQRDYRLSPVGVFLMLDWLKKDKERAEYALSLI